MEPESVAEPPPPFEINNFPISADTDVIGGLYFTRVQRDETLLDIARAYNLGYDEIIAANPDIDLWWPGEGERVVLPLAHVLPAAPRRGIVINLAARRLFYYPAVAAGEPQRVITHPIGIGREGWSTPVGNTLIANKQAAPAWTVPISILREHAAKDDPLPAVVPPGPDNPLGSHALRLGWPSILIHGTNKPAGIGMRVSHGCIQLYPEDIAPLFDAVPVDTPVTVVDQPYLVGSELSGSATTATLVLEAHPTADGKIDFAAIQKLITAAVARVADGMSADPSAVDQPTVNWHVARTLAKQGRGYPLPITLGGSNADALLAALPQAPPLFPPVGPTPEPGEWFVDLGEFKYERNARQLVAMLRYQGPAIPARRLARGDQFQVLAGPWPSQQAAAAAARRIERELAETGRVIRIAEAELNARL